MLYHFFDFLTSNFDLPGSGVMRYLSFRSAMAVVFALLIVIYCGKSIIRALQRHQIGESIRDLGLQGQLEKKGTPTMGGVIILLAIVVPVLLFARLDNIYTILLLVATIWCGVLIVNSKLSESIRDTEIMLLVMQGQKYTPDKCKIRPVGKDKSTSPTSVADMITPLPTRSWMSPLFNLLLFLSACTLPII